MSSSHLAMSDSTVPSATNNNSALSMEPMDTEPLLLPHNNINKNNNNNSVAALLSTQQPTIPQTTTSATRQHGGDLLKVDDDCSSSFGDEEVLAYDEETAHENGVTDTKDSSSTLEYRNVTLWQFLLELLVNKREPSIIQWTDREGEFMLLQPEQVARLWGMRKSKNSKMNYDKLSRALRYYYQKNIIQKVPGQKFMYRFVHLPDAYRLSSTAAAGSTNGPAACTNTTTAGQQGGQSQQPQQQLSPVSGQTRMMSQQQPLMKASPPGPQMHHFHHPLMTATQMSGPLSTAFPQHDDIKVEPREDLGYPMENKPPPMFLGVSQHGQQSQEITSSSSCGPIGAGVSLGVNPPADFPTDISSALPMLCSVAKRLAMVSGGNGDMNSAQPGLDGQAQADFRAVAATAALGLHSAALQQQQQQQLEDDLLLSNGPAAKRHCPTCRCHEMDLLNPTKGLSPPLKNAASPLDFTSLAAASLSPHQTPNSTDALLLQKSQEFLARCLLASATSSSSTSVSSTNFPLPFATEAISQPTSRKRAAPPTGWSLLEQLSQQLQAFANTNTTDLPSPTKKSTNPPPPPPCPAPAVFPSAQPQSSSQGNLFASGPVRSNVSVSESIVPSVCQDQQSHLHALNMKQLSKAIMKYWSGATNSASPQNATSHRTHQPEEPAACPAGTSPNMSTGPGQQQTPRGTKRFVGNQHLAPQSHLVAQQSQQHNFGPNLSPVPSQQPVPPVNNNQLVAAALNNLFSGNSTPQQTSQSSRLQPLEDEAGISSSTTTSSSQQANLNPLSVLKDYFLQNSSLWSTLQNQLKDNGPQTQQAQPPVTSASYSTPSPIVATVSTHSPTAQQHNGAASSGAVGEMTSEPDASSLSSSSTSSPIKEEPRVTSVTIPQVAVSTAPPSTTSTSTVAPTAPAPASSSSSSSSSQTWPLPPGVDANAASCVWMPVPLQLASNIWQLSLLQQQQQVQQSQPPPAATETSAENINSLKNSSTNTDHSNNPQSDSCTSN